MGVGLRGRVVVGGPFLHPGCLNGEGGGHRWEGRDLSPQTHALTDRHSCTHAPSPSDTHSVPHNPATHAGPVVLRPGVASRQMEHQLWDLGARQKHSGIYLLKRLALTWCLCARETRFGSWLRTPSVQSVKSFALSQPQFPCWIKGDGSKRVLQSRDWAQRHAAGQLTVASTWRGPNVFLMTLIQAFMVVKNI